MVESSDKTWSTGEGNGNSMVGLLKGGGEVVTGLNMASNFSVVFMRPLVRSEVAGVGEEGLFPGTMEN